jgi:hypothetical protein
MAPRTPAVPGLVLEHERLAEMLRGRVGENAKR